MEKKLYRIREGKKIAGVCGGIAEYFAIDPTIIRLIWALVSLFAGAGILVYIVCAFVIPEKTTNYIDVD
jgi:phage shock protein C